MTEPRIPEISPAELLRAVEAGDPLQIVDVRTAAAVRGGHIDLLPPDRFVNVVGSQLIARTDLDGLGLAPSLRTVAVCGHGNSSRGATEHLRSLGLEAYSLTGGMAAWMNLVAER
ncbi:MAG: rhodanese-like domain-containing protein, partial [Candidatus Eisenbacteria bacterium]|nr:rhodanese-like domain-containing protein [Candidatus Eisenbacteria bacterium]